MTNRLIDFASFLAVVEFAAWLEWSTDLENMAEAAEHPQQAEALNNASSTAIDWALDAREKFDPHLNEDFLFHADESLRVELEELG